MRDLKFLLLAAFALAVIGVALVFETDKPRRDSLRDPAPSVGNSGPP